MDIINDIVWHSFLLFLWFGSIVAALVGIGLLVAPHRTEKINAYLGHWIDTRKIQDEFDRPRWTERYIYRYHRVIGSGLLAGALVVLYKFLLTPTKQKIATLVQDDVLGLFDGIVAIFIVGSCLAAVIGSIMIVRPSMLRDFETAANHWISTERLQRLFDDKYLLFDNYVLRYKRLFGLLLLVGGLYVASVLGKLLLQGQWQL